MALIRYLNIFNYDWRTMLKYSIIILFLQQNDVQYYTNYYHLFSVQNQRHNLTPSAPQQQFLANKFKMLNLFFRRFYFCFALATS